jgi:Predicted metal-dependent hydrolase with the TIM-barrel fold
MEETAWIKGNILTMDSSRPRASAMLVRGETIELVGEEREVLDRAGPGAAMRDLGGRTVVPGFNDNHVHAVFMGDHALMPDLSGLGAAAIVALLKERFPAPERSEVIRGFNWDYPACPDPRKELLDEAFPDNPVVLSQYSGHAQWLNGAALRAIGIDRSHGPDKKSAARNPGGQVLRDPDGEPTGVVRDLGDTPLSLKRYMQAYFSRRAREKRLGIALETFARLGISSVQDNSWFYPELFSLRSRLGRGELSARFSCWTMGRMPGFRAAMDAAFGLGIGAHDWIEPGPVKFFVDGTFSTRNACLLEPFLDGGGDGPDPEPQLDRLTFLARRRRQGAFHIIGDRGIARFLDSFEEVAARYPILKDLRIRIEHAQLIDARDIERIARLGVLVAAQPTALGSPEKDRAILGRERARRAYPYRSLLDAGVGLSFGSDIPGESGCDPIRSLHMIANREGPESISVMEALRCYTVGSAYAEGAEGRKGALAPGMLADFAVLSRDVTSIPRETIGDTVVEETVVGGRTVYKRATP